MELFELSVSVCCIVSRGRNGEIRWWWCTLYCGCLASINLVKPTDDSSSSRRVLAFYWVTQTCSKEDLSLHFIACDGTELAVLA